MIFAGPQPQSEEMLESLVKVFDIAWDEGEKHRYDPTTYARCLSFIGLSLILAFTEDRNKANVIHAFCELLSRDLKGMSKELRGREKELDEGLAEARKKAQAMIEEENLDEILDKVPDELRQQVDEMMAKALKGKPN